MPGYDGSGPAGTGPMTGGGKGFCNTVNTGYQRQSNDIAGFGRGMGFRRGARGRSGLGMRRGFGWSLAQNQPGYTGSPANEVNELKTEVAAVKTVLETISQKIAVLEKT